MLSFSHVGLAVTDLECSIRFYEEVLGLKCLERHSDNGRGLQIAFLGTDAPVLELLYYTDSSKQERSQRGHYNHLAWHVPDLAPMIERLQQYGIRLEEPGVRTVLDGRQVAFFYGPDGERIELVQPVR